MPCPLIRISFDGRYLSGLTATSSHGASLVSGANGRTGAFKGGSPPPINAVFPSLPGLDNAFVILRTNATEAPSKLPIHFATTLHCTPHYAIYSDPVEEIAGHPIHDALGKSAARAPCPPGSPPRTPLPPLLARLRGLAPLPNASAALSYRGGSPAEIESLWRFEWKWYGQVGSSISFFSPGW